MSEQRSCNGVVAIRKDVCFYPHLVAHGALCREAATVYLRCDSFDNDAPASI